MGCQWHDPPWCGDPYCRHRPGPHCDDKHDFPRCTDADCHLICASIRHQDLPHYHREQCPDPNCTNIRGWDRYRDRLTNSSTIKQVWSAIYDVSTAGPPGDQQEKRVQKKRFNKEFSTLKRELAEMMKEKALEFVARWRTKHLPGDP